MLCSKIRINKKGMTFSIIVTIVLSLLIMAIILLLVNSRLKQSTKVGIECSNNQGSCVSVSECDACTTFVDCKLIMPYSCKNNDEGKKQVCCPNSEVK